MLKEILELKKIDNQSLFEMANISTKKTGLPVIVWISVKFENHKPRIKIMNKNCKVSISIEDKPQILVGNCKSNKIIEQVKKWIKINKNVLLDYWNMKITTDEAIELLKKV